MTSLPRVLIGDFIDAAVYGFRGIHRLAVLAAPRADVNAVNESGDSPLIDDASSLSVDIRGELDDVQAWDGRHASIIGHERLAAGSQR